MAFALAELFWVGILPCVMAAVILLGCQRLAVRPTAAWAASLGGGLALGQFGLAARTSWQATLAALLQPHEARDWLPWLVLVVAGLGVLAAYVPSSWRRWMIALACLFALSVPARLLAGSVYVTSRWSLLEKLAVLGLWSAVLAAMWFLLAAGRANGQPRLRGGLLVVAAIGMAITITLSGSFTTGELSGVVAAALTGTLLGEACFSTPAATGSASASTDGLSGAVGVLAVALGGLILLAYYYVLLPNHTLQLSSIITALSILGVVAAGGRLPTGWPRGPVPQTAVRAALCLVPLAIALALAFAAATTDPYDL
jgi:hypothetical protein